MSGKVVYLVRELFDNGEDYDCHTQSDDVIAVCTTKEIAERFIEERRNELLNKEYEPFYEWVLGTPNTYRVHKIVSKMEDNEYSAMGWDIVVGAEDGTEYAPTNETGVYEFLITEMKLDEKRP